MRLRMTNAPQQGYARLPVNKILETYMTSYNHA